MRTRLAGALLLAACAHADPSAPVGSRENPIRSESRRDEVDYLGRLRCSDGSAPHWRQTASAPVSPHDGILWSYHVRCVWLNREAVVHFDRRHGASADEAPPGFSLAGDSPQRLPNQRRARPPPLPRH